MLFKKKKSVSSEPIPTFEMSVPYSDRYQGYKRIKLDTYKDPEADKGIQWFKAAAKVDQITFREYLFPDTPPLIRVYGDGHKIGTIWSSSWEEYYGLIKAGRAQKASVGFAGLGDLFLFVKFD